jgi:hypothetical protein
MVKIGIKEIGWYGVDGIHLIKDGDPVARFHEHCEELSGSAKWWGFLK